MNRRAKEQDVRHTSIAVVIDAFTQGGAQRNLELIIPIWIRNGNQVTLVLIQDSDNELIMTELALLGVEIERIRANSMLDLSAILRFFKIMKPFRRQIVISNLYWSQIWSAVAKLRFPSIKLTWVEHNTYLKRSSTQWVIYRACSKLTNRRYGVSLEIVQFLGIKGIRGVSVISNAVIPQELKSNSHKESKTILFVGRLNEQKNPLLALQVFLQFLNEVDMPSNYKLRILGSGPLASQMQEFVLKNKLEANVEFLGFLEKNRVATEMSSASVLLMTSLQEGSPLVRLEALERGMCIVTTRTSGLLGFLVDEVTGDVQAPGIFVGGSPQELSQSLKISFEDFFWTENAVYARKSLVSALTPEIVALQYL